MRSLDGFPGARGGKGICKRFTRIGRAAWGKLGAKRRGLLLEDSWTENFTGKGVNVGTGELSKEAKGQAEEFTEDKKKRKGDADFAWRSGGTFRTVPCKKKHAQTKAGKNHRKLLEAPLY